MRQNSSWGFPVWLLSLIVGAVMVFPIAAYLSLRRPPPLPAPALPPPSAVVVSECRAVALGMRRVEGRGLNIMFDVPEAAFALHVGGPDMPPRNVYCVTAKNAGTTT
jgi:hypothetical protein